MMQQHHCNIESRDSVNVSSGAQTNQAARVEVIYKCVQRGVPVRVACEAETRATVATAPFTGEFEEDS